MNATTPLPREADSYEAFYDRLDSSGRSAVDRHVIACEAEPTLNHLRLWKRLAGFLARLTPHSIRTTGQKAVQFYAADGNYRQQLFALEDLRDGKLSIYSVEAVEAGARVGVLRRGPDDEGAAYALADAPGEYLVIDTLTAATTTSAPDYFKHLLGWNRKAVRIVIPIDASPGQLRAAEDLCALAARQTTAALQRPVVQA